MDNKSGGDDLPDLQRPTKSMLMSQLTEEDKEFVENIDDEYYKRVRTSDEYYRRKKLILMHLDKLEAKVAP